MNARTDEIKGEISKLQGELQTLLPAEGLSVRALAKRVGISPSTAHRFKAGKSVDVPTAKRLIDAGIITECPCCGHIRN